MSIASPLKIRQARAAAFRAVSDLIDTVGSVIGTMTNFVDNPWVTDAPTQLPQHVSLEFDGTDDYISLASGVDLTGAFTIAAWCTWGGGNDDIICGGTSPNDYGLLLATSTINTKIDATTYNASHGLTLVSGQWYHVCVTRDGSNNLEWYIDGTSVGTASSATGTLTISAIGAYANGTNPLTGKLADLQIWNVEKDATAVGNLANGQESTSDLVARWRFNGS